jgi:hypothetical protein
MCLVVFYCSCGVAAVGILAALRARGSKAFTLLPRAFKDGVRETAPIIS